VSISDRKWSFSSRGICPPEINTPASMFFSMACPVRFALVMTLWGSAALALRNMQRKPFKFFADRACADGKGHLRQSIER
jgi:hypothetical protein